MASSPTRSAVTADALTHLTPGVVNVADWAEFPWLRAGFSTRQGGQTIAYSKDAVPEQNLGWTPEDPAATVAENRRRFIDRFDGFAPSDLITLRQLHGDVVQLVVGGVPLATPEGKAILQGDGLMTIQPGHLLGIQTADCVPVLLADTRTRAVAAFHAGWRGTVARIVEHGVDSMQREFGSRPEDLIAAIGPAIGPCCFAVGEDVRSEFEREFSYADELVTTAPSCGPDDPGPQIHVDLWEANRRQLLRAGLATNAITLVGECTACARTPAGQRKYFSHRAERGYTGRMLSVIGVARP